MFLIQLLITQFRFRKQDRPFVPLVHERHHYKNLSDGYFVLFVYDKSSKKNWFQNFLEANIIISNLHSNCLLPKMYKKLIFLLSLYSVDIEPSPEPKKTISIPFCYWNLNNITSHDFSKTTLFKALATSSQCDIICLSETFLDSTIKSDDKRLKIEAYKLIREDHPGSKKMGEVCINYKGYLTIGRRGDLCTLQECLVVEIKSRGKSFFFICLFRYPCQN